MMIERFGRSRRLSGHCADTANRSLLASVVGSSRTSDRVNFLMDDRYGIPALTLLEVSSAMPAETTVRRFQEPEKIKLSG